LAIAIDQLTKLSAGSFFTIVKNYGLLFNMLEDLPVNVKVVALGTATGLLFFFYLTYIYLIKKSLSTLRYALTILMAGIISNTMDKILQGFTTDFIPLGSYAFNVADIMTVGPTCFLMFYLVKHHQDLWPDMESRRSILINPKAQIMFGLKYSLIAVCTSIILGLMTYTYITNFIFPSILTSSNNLLPIFLVLHITISLLFSAIVFVFGIFISHRFVGPIMALERFVENLAKGRTPNLVLREGDYFKQLEELGKKIQEIKKGSDTE
jgi:lipoprotein signal peptidase